MPSWLTKQYGPFTGTVWVVVLVGGVGLGLVMRRFMGGDGGDAASSEPIGTTTQPAYGVETGAPAFVGGGGTLYNQGEIVSDVLEALREQSPPPATTEPTVNTSVPNRDWEAFVDYGEPGWWTAAQRYEEIFGRQPSKSATVAKINAEIRRAQADPAKWDPRHPDYAG